MKKFTKIAAALAVAAVSASSQALWDHSWDKHWGYDEPAPKPTIHVGMNWNHGDLWLYDFHAHLWVHGVNQSKDVTKECYNVWSLLKGHHTLCGPSGVAAATADVRVCHASAGAPTVKGIINSDVVAAPVSFGQISEYDKTATGNVTFELKTPEHKPVAEYPVQLNENAKYTQIILGNAGDKNILIDESIRKNCKPGAGQAAVLVVNGVDSANTASLFVGEKKVDQQGIEFVDPRVSEQMKSFDFTTFGESLNYGNTYCKIVDVNGFDNGRDVLVELKQEGQAIPRAIYSATVVKGLTAGQVATVVGTDLRNEAGTVTVGTGYDPIVMKAGVICGRD